MSGDTTQRHVFIEKGGAIGLERSIQKSAT
jgi:hypothetical protein